MSRFLVIVGILFIIVVFCSFDLIHYNCDFERKITKNICFQALFWSNTHFFLVKMQFFFDFCLLVANFILYLRQNFHFYLLINHLKTTKL